MKTYKSLINHVTFSFRDITDYSYLKMYFLQKSKTFHRSPATRACEGRKNDVTPLTQKE